MYKALRDEPEFDVNAGNTVDLELTVEREQELLDAGRFEIVPREYKVVGTSRVMECNPGETFKAALPLAREEILIAGGHIERAKATKPSKPEEAKK